MRRLQTLALLLLVGCEGARERPKPLPVALPPAASPAPRVLFVDLFQRCPVPSGTNTTVDTAETALAKKPQDPLLLRSVGLAYYAAGGYEAAEKALRAAVERAPRDSMAALYQGYCQLALGSNAEAQRTLAQIPPTSNAYAAARRELGNLHFQALHQDQKAELYYQQAAQARGAGGEELLALGLFRASQKKEKEARTLVLRAASLLPPGPRRAVAYAALAKLTIVPEEARTWNQKALSDDPENPWAKKAFGQ